MAVQKPLVLVGGNILQLPIVDVLAKADVGLGNVDNTSDASKPVSTDQQTALNLKQDTLVSGTNIKTIGGASVLGSGDLAVIGGLVTTPIKTANYTAVVNDLVRVDSTTGSFTVTLPATLVDGDKVGLFDIANKCATYAVLIAVAGGKTIEGDSMGLSVNVNGAYVYLIYNSTGTNWKIAETASSPSVTVFREVHVATVSQTAFTTGIAYLPSANALNVYINGIKQFPSAYVETNSTTVTFITGLTIGDNVLFEINTGVIGLASVASTVSFNPTGGIASNNVQAALAELDTEKQELLVSTSNIKTVGGISLLGTGDVPIPASTGSTLYLATNFGAI